MEIKTNQEEKITLNELLSVVNKGIDRILPLNNSFYEVRFDSPLLY